VQQLADPDAASTTARAVPLDVADRHAPERVLEDGSATDLLLFGLAGTLEFSTHVREQSGGVAVLQ